MNCVLNHWFWCMWYNINFRWFYSTPAHLVYFTRTSCNPVSSEVHIVYLLNERSKLLVGSPIDLYLISYIYISPLLLKTASLLWQTPSIHLQACSSPSLAKPIICKEIFIPSLVKVSHSGIFSVRICLMQPEYLTCNIFVVNPQSCFWHLWHLRSHSTFWGNPQTIFKVFL